MGATNRPQDLDPAILRRMPTMFHVDLPVSSYPSSSWSIFSQILIVGAWEVKENALNHLSHCLMAVVPKKEIMIFLSMFVQNTRQRQDILRLILAGENVRNALFQPLRIISTLIFTVKSFVIEQQQQLNGVFRLKHREAYFCFASFKQDYRPVWNYLLCWSD